MFSFQASQRAFRQKLKYVHQYKNLSILSVICEGPVEESHKHSQEELELQETNGILSCMLSLGQK